MPKKTGKIAKIIRARQLRREMTETEKILWPYLRDRTFLGHKFRRQHILRGFIIDFYCPARKLAIELDGPIHDRQKEADGERQQAIESCGITLLRFSNKEIVNGLKSALRTIKAQLHPSPSLMEKGNNDKPRKTLTWDEDLCLR